MRGGGEKCVAALRDVVLKKNSTIFHACCIILHRKVDNEIEVEYSDVMTDSLPPLNNPISIKVVK